MSCRPIGDYALLSDCNWSALVSRDGSVDWLCLPRFDSRSVFARLLDDRAGHWLVRPAGEFSAERGYVGPTMVLRTVARWREPDHGIWEVRGEPRHFLYSKLMCWVALDRAIDLAGWLGATGWTGDWQQTREEIRDAIQRHGWSEQAGAFTQAFGSDQLDASSLMIPITGFLPASDPRVRATIDAIQRDLTGPGGLVYRYRGGDGLGGSEGAFLLCTFWLARSLALAGDTEQAGTVFETAAGHANDVGLLAEEIDPATGEQLGNFPQAFSHIGLINDAWTIAQAEAATRHPPGGRRR